MICSKEEYGNKDEIKPSGTLLISEKVRALRREGEKVLNFGLGDPDFDTPDHIKRAAINAINDNLTHYSHNRGLLELRKAIAHKLLQENNIQSDPTSEIIVTPGAKHAIFCTILALIEPGDEVLFFDPAYVSYEPMIRIAGGTAVRVPLRKEDEFVLKDGMIDKFYTPRTKMFLLNTPHNPTGKVFTRREMETIRYWAIKNKVIVLTDEIYEKIIFDDQKHFSIGSFPGMKELTITTNGFSKSYAMTGWRLGYLAGPKKLINKIIKVHQHCATCTCTFSQKAGIEALKGSRETIEPMIQEYERRRNLVLERLVKIEGLNFIIPKGTFYFFLDISFTGLSSEEVAGRLLEEKLVAVTPGVAFGEHYDSFIRISLTLSIAEIKEAIKRMERFFQELK
ncbi:pyridoxal phosphate-dependent aminotransferase [Thermodesulfobacteriota bacterium]